MPAPDTIHDAVRNALVKDGWLITHDPYVIQFEEITLFADLGAERAMAAQLGSHKIVVEVKSFVSRSPIQDLKLALGQYDLYQGFLELVDPERKLFLAVSRGVYNGLFSQRTIQMIAQRYELPILVVDIETEEIVAWTKSHTIEI